jgi:hypothetical protein
MIDDEVDELDLVGVEDLARQKAGKCLFRGASIEGKGLADNSFLPRARAAIMRASPSR